MSGPAGTESAYGIVHDDEAFERKFQLQPEARAAVDRLEREIARDPLGFKARSRPASRSGDTLIYEHPDPVVEITYEIDTERERVYFFNYFQRFFKAKKTIFISYSQNDVLWLEKLAQVFEILEAMGGIELFDDNKIEAGTDWRTVINEKLESAKAAVLLVSPTFLESKFIKEVELPKLLGRSDLQVFWVHLSKSEVETKQPAIWALQSLLRDPRVTLADLLQQGDDSLSGELLRMAKKLARTLEN